ncbi:hypothetical protein Avbf_02330, partial [Armadillidium vulgare]
VIYSKDTPLIANSTTPSDSSDSRDSYDHNVIYSKRTALTANFQHHQIFMIPEIHMIIMIICPASFFRCQRTKNSLFKNSKNLIL